MITKVLITVMTYPTLSRKYLETVCTAGFKEDGSWIRIFPVPHRLLTQINQKYKKWQWIEADLEQNPNHDDRPESYHIKNIDSLKILGNLSYAKKTDWDLRYEYIRKGKVIYDDMSTIVDLAKQNRLSLAVLKPKEVLDLTYEKINLEGLNEKKKMLEKKYEADRMQPNLFQDPESLDYSFQFAEQIPYRFKYVFTTKDCKKREIMVEDWEIGMLYRNCFKKYQDEIRACEKVRNKYLGFKDNDLLFFMGTSYEWQKRNSPNPFLIIGVFPAKKGTFERGRQLKLPL